MTDRTKDELADLAMAYRHEEMLDRMDDERLVELDIYGEPIFEDENEGSEE